MPRNSATNRSKQRNYNAAIAFNGSSSELLKSTPTGLNTGSGSMSFVTWAFINNRTLVTYADLLTPVMGRRFCLGYSVICYYFSDGVNGANNLTLTDAQFESIGTNKFVRLVWALTSTAVSIYCNGALIKTQSLGVTMNSGTYTKLTIGDTGSGLQYVNGILADSYFTNSALSLEEVQEDYYKAVYPSGLASAWLMGEGAGSAITDRVGSNSLTAANITWTSQTPAKSRKLSVNANMVKNGDFEYAPPFTAATNNASARWIDGTSSGSLTNDLFGWWNIVGVSTFAGSFDSTTKRSGLYSLKIEATDVTGRGRVTNCPFETTTTQTLIRQYGIPVKENQDYLLSGYIKTNNVTASALRLSVQFFTGSGTALTSSAGSFLPATQDFTLESRVITTPATAQYVRIVFDLTAAGNICQAWLDDLTFTPVYPEGRVPANGNLVKNFDFEVAPTFVAAGATSARWIDGTSAGSTTNSTYKWAFAQETGTGLVQYDSSTAHLGTYSMKLSTTATGSLVQVAPVLSTNAADVVISGIRATPSTDYTLTFWMKTNYVSGDSNDGAYILVSFSDSFGTGLSSSSSTKIKTTTDWTQYTLNFTTTSLTQIIYPRLRIEGSTGTATLIMDAWFDDIYLAKTTNPGRIQIT
jgi:hypothetical protein